MALAVAPFAPAQSSTYPWTGTFSDIVPPQIDATNFVNRGVFNVNVPADLITASSYYYDFSSVLNYTNTGSMFGNAGFVMDFEPSYFIPPVPHVPFNKMSANFVNQRNGPSGGNIFCTGFASNSFFFPGLSLVGNAKFIATATNIINSGSILLDNSAQNNIFFGIGNAFNTTPVNSLIKLTGENVDLREGELGFTATTTVSNVFFGVTSVGVSSADYGVGTDTNGDWNPGIDLQQNRAFSSFFQTINGTTFFLDLTNSIPYSFSVNNGFNTVVKRAIFLQDTSPGVINHVYFGGGAIVGAGAAHIEWVAPFIDPETSALMTNYLYLSDLYAAVTTNTFVYNGIPINYSFSQSTSPQLGLGNAETPNLPFFPSATVSNLYAYVDARLVATSTSSNSSFGGALTNLPQRIEITASRTLKLDNARISGPDYLSLKSTNQFEGNVGASINVPFADLNLGVTNGFLTISNLMRPTLPRWSGTVQAFTARWFDVTPGGITNDNRVVLVNSHLIPTTAPQVQDLFLHATNSLVISDALTVSRNLLVDATHLTLTTNGLGVGALSDKGELNFLSPNILWSASLPRLKYLTNSGVITAQNQIYFAGNMLSPYSDPNAATPYESFVNHGAITNQGSYIVAKYFVNDGIFQNNANGNFNLIAGCAFLTNGTINAPVGAGDITIAADSLVISNHVLQAGGRLSLAVSNCFSDGFSLFNQFGHIVTTNTVIGVVSNGNFWALNGDYSMPVKPATGDLLGTTISNTAAPFANALVTWAGKDRGCVPAGFVNNLAIGRLILDGNTGSKFSFNGAGAGNAIYVDRLELIGSATNLGASSLTNILIGSNLRIYYAQALANGVSIAEKLNNGNGGRFCWVSNYAGVFSATNLFYSSGISYTFNEALAESCNVDSRAGTLGDNGAPNCSSYQQSPAQDPIPTNWLFDVVVTNAPCGCETNTTLVPGSGPGGSLGAHHSDNPDSTWLPFPVELEEGSHSNLFRRAQRNFNGLFYETNGVARHSAGYFSGALSQSNLLSAKLRLGRDNYNFSGRFDLAGHLVNTNLKASQDNSQPDKQAPSLTADLQLSLGGDRITGQIISSNWTAALLAERLATNAMKGQYTFVIPGDAVANTNNPAGHGYGTVTILSNGSLIWSGVLADKTSMAQSSGISDRGVWPLYSTPYAGHAGLVLGWIQFDPVPTDTDLSGDILWIKPGGLNEKYYPAGFTNQIEVVGSAYVKPPVTSSNGAVVLTGGNLGQSISNRFTLKPNYQVNNQGTNKFNLTISKSDGTFQGSQITATSPVKVKSDWRGVLLQKMQAGYGFFLGTNQSGQVWYTPLP